MEYLPYNLKGNNITSDKFYKDIKVISKNMKIELLSKGNGYLEDFMKYVLDKNIEQVRSKEEYGMELLLLGVLLKEYSQYGGVLSRSMALPLSILNSARQSEKYKNKIDKVRGYLISNILCKTKAKGKNNLNRLIAWLSESGDFVEEVYRLKTWEKFLQGSNSEYRNKVIEVAFKLTDKLEEICEEPLKPYMKDYDKFISGADDSYKNREDILYCTKGKIQYYFNMVCSQIMNEVYKERFLSCKYKKVFVPACMKQQEKPCAAINSKFGYKCRQCNCNCNVNKINMLVKKASVEVCIIPHETIINTLSKTEKDEIGIIGIACVPNLMSGGWKALRLGFIPQCVLLDSCGCKKHWLKQGKMTEINMVELCEVLKIKALR